MSLWLRVLLAFVVPVAWGLGSAWLFDRLAALRRKRTSKPGERLESHK